MRKLVLLLLLSALVVLPAAAQTPPRNVAYGELLGNGIILTVNYERGFTDRVFGRIGFSYVTGESENDTDSTFIIPVMVNYVTRPQANHHLEAGAGFTLLTGDSQDLFDDEIEDENFSNLVRNVLDRMGFGG